MKAMKTIGMWLLPVLLLFSGVMSFAQMYPHSLLSKLAEDPTQRH